MLAKVISGAGDICRHFILIEVIGYKERNMAIRSRSCGLKKPVRLFLPSFSYNERYYDLIYRIKGNPYPGISKLVSQTFEVV